MNTKINLTDQEENMSAELEAMSAGQRLQFLHRNWGERLIASTSFGLQSCVMLHLISQHASKIPVIFIDTGYLFPETYRYAERLMRLFNLNIQVYTSRYSSARINALWGEVWKQGEIGERRYSNITKIEPMNRALRDFRASMWVSGLRRSQSSSRANRNLVEPQNRIFKAYPILDWSDEAINDYISDHRLPEHPLKEKGYVTMGDTHSTRPITKATDVEETRFDGKKYECGLHLPSKDTNLLL